MFAWLLLQPALPVFSVTNEDLRTLLVHILNAKPTQLTRPQTAAIQQQDDQAFLPLSLCRLGAGFDELTGFGQAAKLVRFKDER